MSIGTPSRIAPTPPPESPPAEWCVPVSISVVEHVPAAILRSWIIIESFARGQAECWPGNTALSARLGVTTRNARRAIEDLEDHGIAERRPMPGNRRTIFLIRRTSGTMSPAEWKTLADRAARRAAGRTAVAKSNAGERKRYKPPVKIVG